MTTGPALKIAMGLIAVGTALSLSIAHGHAAPAKKAKKHHPPPSATTATTPSTLTSSFYVNPNSSPAQQVSQQSDPADQALIKKIASEPMAVWLTDPNADNGAIVSSLLAAAANEAVVFVIYMIPNRDCGSYSSGGAQTADQYRSVISTIAAAVKGRPAWFIVEPDALPEINSCGLDATGIAQREQLLSFAAQTLTGVSNHVYLDAGHSNWQAATYMAPILTAAGIQYATGFSLNVSNFNPTAAEQTYGDQLSALVGGKHYVVDTSRNAGTTPQGQWCNPPGALLGAAPTLVTGDPLDDAGLWIKTPGESDGTCGAGQPPAGQWYESYALGLASTGT
jgi:endoglucanase